MNDNFKMSKSKKAQIISIDIMIALVIFIIIFVSLFSGWFFSLRRFEVALDYKELEFLSQFAANALFMPGIPYDWHTAGGGLYDPQTIGLGDGRRVLMYEKIVAASDFAQTNYSDFKRLLGVLGPGYNFFVNISIFDSLEYIDNTSFGIPPSNASHVAISQRYGLLDSTWAKVVVSVWVES